MKIHRRNFLIASSAALLAHNKLSFGSSKARSLPLPSAQKTVNVYTTANNTDLRISPTDKLSFKSVGQPKETQICVFVDPTKQFQTFLGIGGALTDASAEVFAMLPSQTDRDSDAYFDEKRHWLQTRPHKHSQLRLLEQQLHLRQ